MKVNGGLSYTVTLRLLWLAISLLAAISVTLFVLVEIWGSANEDESDIYYLLAVPLVVAGFLNAVWIVMLSRKLKRRPRE